MMALRLTGLLWIALSTPFLVAESKKESPVASLVLKQDVLSDQDSVSLEDLVICQGSPLCDEFYALEVIPNLQPGQKITVHAQTLTEMLRKEWPSFSFTFEGKVTTVTNLTPLMEEEQIFNIIKTKIEEFSYDHTRYKIALSYFRTLGSASIPEGALIQLRHFEEVASNPLPFLNRFRHKNQVQLSFTWKQLQKEFAAIMQISAEIKYPVAKKEISAQKEILSENIDFIWTDFFSIQKQYALDEKEIIGKTSAESVPAGHFFRSSSLHRPTLIQRGQVLQAAYTESHLSITVMVKALMSGGLDDMIEVKTLAGDKTLKALIKEDGSLLIRKT